MQLRSRRRRQGRLVWRGSRRCRLAVCASSGRKMLAGQHRRAQLPGFFPSLLHACSIKGIPPLSLLSDLMFASLMCALACQPAFLGFTLVQSKSPVRQTALFRGVLRAAGSIDSSTRST